MRVRLIVSCVFAALALCFAAPALAAGTLPVKQLTLERKAPTYEITILYPQTGNAKIDEQAAAWAKAQADWFQQNSAGNGFGGAPYALDISFTVTRNDNQMFETLFEMEMNTGGAHPNHDLATLNFMSDGTRVFFPEIFGIDGMKRVSDPAVERLIKDLAQGDEPVTNADNIRSGALPHPGALETFSLGKDALTLYFPEYQIAPYGAGPQMTQIPLARLRAVMRNDWHKPQPSFDCDKAQTPVEHALCGDVALARLDRQLAKAYYWQVRLAEDDAAKTRARDGQRAWLAQRDAACAGQADAALAQCLVAQYQARLTPLHVQPE